MNRPTANSRIGEKISRSPWVTLAILSCVGLMAMFADTMILPAIPDLIRDFNINYSTSSWILASFLITGAVMTPIAGRLSDMYGKKKMLLIIVGIYTIGICVAAISTNFTVMIIARIMQGVGASMFAISFGIIRDKFTPEKLAVAQGIFSSMFSAGAVIGVAIGGTIINNFGWHTTFLLVIPIAIVLFVAISRFIHIDMDKATARISDKNTEFCCRFIHVRRDILLSESSSTTTEYDSRSRSINKNKSTIDMMGAITLSITVISFLVALQFIQTVNGSTLCKSTHCDWFWSCSNYFPVIFYYGREKGNFSINRSQSICKQNSTSCEYHKHDSWHYCVNGSVSDYTYIDSKSISARIWRKCIEYCQRSIALYGYIINSIYCFGFHSIKIW